MRSIKTVGLVLIAAFVLGGSATAASAHEFVASNTGTLSGVAETAQEFQMSLGKLDCEEASMSGVVSAPLAKATQDLTVHYEECEVLGTVFTASPAEYEFAANGTAVLLKPFVMQSALCTVEFFQSTGNPLNSVSYSDEGGSLHVLTRIANLSYNGGSCGSGDTNVYGALALSLQGSGANTFEWV